MKSLIGYIIGLLIAGLPVFTLIIFFIRNVYLVNQKFGFFKTDCFVFDGLQIGLLVFSIAYAIIEIIVGWIWLYK